MTPYLAAHPPAASRARAGGLWALSRALRRALDGAFGALSLTVLLATVVTVPIAAFFTLGYMLRAAARVGATGRLTEAFGGLAQASRLGQIALGTWLWTLPLRLVVSLHADAVLIDPGSREARRLLWTGHVTLVLALFAILAALAQGGKLIHFARPIRGLRALIALGAPERRAEAAERVRALVAAFGVSEAWWIGLRCYVAAGLWLLLPTAVLAWSDRHGLLAVVAGVALAVVAARVPFLQMNAAVHGELRRGLSLSDVRYVFARAPLAFAFALLVTVLSSLPLYLLKIELIPRDALWLPSIVFVGTIFPGKLATGWAYHRGARREKPVARPLRWVARLLIAPIALAYALVVYLSPSLGWHGELGMFEHHAFLLPVPF